ncbi:MAG TPA: CoA-binding protein [Thermoanaerobaculia bacterium]|nr:CoA-binding protein [Thermoanaerobaculia bacterium]
MPPYSDAHLLSILERVRTIAMVGASSDWRRPSYFAMKYLQEKGYRVIPINPRVAAQSGEAGAILGERAYASLREAPAPIDMVDVFRSSEAAGEVVDEAIAVAKEKGIWVVWMQLGVVNEDAARRAEAAGLTVVMDRCPKIEWSRLHRELAWSGFNTGVISSQRPRWSPDGASRPRRSPGEASGRRSA